MLVCGCTHEPSAGKQVLVTEGLSAKVVDGYWLYLSKAHNAKKEWPVILFLQGSDGISPNPRTAKNAGPVQYALGNPKDIKQKLSIADSFIIIIRI